jgi:putative ABC transport system permease protein
VLKVLGATRGVITRAFLIENGITGALAALVAGALGTIAAYFLVTRLMKLDWVFLPAPLLWTVTLAALVTAALGFAGTWRALGAKPAAYLRNE